VSHGYQYHYEYDLDYESYNDILKVHENDTHYEHFDQGQVNITPIVKDLVFN